MSSEYAPQILPPYATAEQRYNQLCTQREPFLRRARDASVYTIPSLIPPEGASGSTVYYQPYQSTGAEGVNNLSAKLLLSLFPSGTSFFRITMDDFVVEELTRRTGQKAEDARAAFEEALGKVERAVTNRMEQVGSRTIHYEALRHLIVGGNGLLYIEDDAHEKFFPLSQFCVKRDVSGHVLEIVVKETLAPNTLPPEARALVEAEYNQSDNKGGDTKEEKSINLYTWVKTLPNGGQTVHQEVCGKVVPGSEGHYPKGKSAWLPLRWTIVPNEDYGRGRCEEFQGDLTSLESLTKSIVDFAAVCSKILTLVDDSGTTNKEDVAQADSGDVIDGNAKDITFLMIEKSQDFQTALKVAADVQHRLERAFLMASAVQRNAERVTAEEIRAMVGELEQSLGGVYSILSEEFQRPLVERVMHRMAASNKLPSLPAGAVSPQIVTGLEGLGRSSDLQKLDAFVRDIGTTFGPEAVAEHVNVGAYMTRRAAALGIDITGLVRTDEEIQQSRQQAAMQGMVEKLGPSGIKAISDQHLAAQEQQQGAQKAA
jgi:hypothetical protein